MRKKLMFLLVPLMLLPLVGFGAAHWYDYIYKQYKLHGGTVCVEVGSWHVDNTTSYDVNCNGVVFGDELQITNLMGVNPCDNKTKVVGVQILADPIFPCWELLFSMYIHNKGTLSVKMDLPNMTFGGPYASDPCWGPIVDPHPMGAEWQYWYRAYIFENGVWVRTEPTTFVLKPSQVVWIQQYIHFLGQDFPQYQCHWFRLDCTFPFFQYVPGEAISSYTWPTPTP